MEILHRTINFIKGEVYNGSQFQGEASQKEVVTGELFTQSQADELLFSEVFKSSNLAKSSAVFGLKNIGNTCYMNSVLQVLFHTLPLINYNKNLHSQCKNKGQNFCALCAIQHLQQNHSPFEFQRSLKILNQKFRIGRQEDSHEFLICLLDQMHKNTTPFNIKQNPKLAETGPIYKIFGGKLKNVVQCQSCQNQSITKEAFLDLSIELTGKPDIQNLLQQFFKKEILSGSEAWYCDKCKGKRTASKQFFVEEVPRILCVHLKRFANQFRKISKPVQYPYEITLQDFLVNKQNLKEKLQYQLYGVVVHYGNSLNGGHYISYIQN